MKFTNFDRTVIHIEIIKTVVDKIEMRSHCSTTGRVQKIVRKEKNAFT